MLFMSLFQKQFGNPGKHPCPLIDSWETHFLNIDFHFEKQVKTPTKYDYNAASETTGNHPT